MKFFSSKFLLLFSVPFRFRPFSALQLFILSVFLPCIFLHTTAALSEQRVGTTSSGSSLIYVNIQPKLQLVVLEQRAGRDPFAKGFCLVNNMLDSQYQVELAAVKNSQSDVELTWQDAGTAPVTIIPGRLSAPFSGSSTRADCKDHSNAQFNLTIKEQSGGSLNIPDSLTFLIFPN